MKANRTLTTTQPSPSTRPPPFPASPTSTFILVTILFPYRTTHPHYSSIPSYLYRHRHRHRHLQDHSPITNHQSPIAKQPHPNLKISSPIDILSSLPRAVIANPRKFLFPSSARPLRRATPKPSFTISIIASQLLVSHVTDPFRAIDEGNTQTLTTFKCAKLPR